MMRALWGKSVIKLNQGKKIVRRKEETTIIKNMLDEREGSLKWGNTTNWVEILFFDYNKEIYPITIERN